MISAFSTESKRFLETRCFSDFSDFSNYDSVPITNLGNQTQNVVTDWCNSKVIDGLTDRLVATFKKGSCMSPF